MFSLKDMKSQRDRKKKKVFAEEQEITEEHYDEAQVDDLEEEERSENQFITCDRMNVFEGQVLNMLEKQNIKFEEQLLSNKQ